MRERKNCCLYIVHVNCLYIVHVNYENWCHVIPAKSEFTYLGVTSKV